MTDNSELQKGFNQGYDLYLSDPKLALKLAKGMSQPYGPYEDGFTHGVLQCIKDRERTREQEKNQEFDIPKLDFNFD